MLFSAWIFLLVVSKMQFTFWSASFLMSNVSLFTRRVINSWKTIQSCRTLQLFSMKRQVTHCWAADMCECDFRGCWPPSLPICQCVSEIRGEFLCVLVWFRLVLCDFSGWKQAVDSPYASQFISLVMTESFFHKGIRRSGAGWMDKSCSDTCSESPAHINTLTHLHALLFLPVCGIQCTSKTKLALALALQWLNRGSWLPHLTNSNNECAWNDTDYTCRSRHHLHTFVS